MGKDDKDTTLGCKAPRWAVAADLLRSGEPAWCRIILVHSYCREPDALWEPGHKPLICWASGAAESNLCPAPACSHTPRGQLRKKSLAWGSHWLFSADSISSCSILRSWEERTSIIMELSRTLGAPRPQAPGYHIPHCHTIPVWSLRSFPSNWFNPFKLKCISQESTCITKAGKHR